MYSHLIFIAAYKQHNKHSFSAVPNGKMVKMSLYDSIKRYFIIIDFSVPTDRLCLLGELKICLLLNTL